MTLDDLQGWIAVNREALIAQLAGGQLRATTGPGRCAYPDREGGGRQVGIPRLVDHDILMARLARRIGDKRLLRIFRRLLQAGMCTTELAWSGVREPHKGTAVADAGQSTAG
jgi:hypothetical protein